MLNARCPKDPDHKRFLVTAHVTQTWEVDEGGNWQSTYSTDETVHNPDPDDIWECAECGTEAEVTR
jgi:hypothetical protein